jgi:PAS domain S-box-containing protein
VPTHPSGPDVSLDGRAGHGSVVARQGAGASVGWRPKFVIKSPHKSLGFPAWLLALLLLIVATLGVSAATPKRVLILDPFGRNVAPFTTVVSSFRTTLARELGEPVDIYELPLELARFSGPEGETPLVTFLAGQLKQQSVDLVVPVGTAGMQFAAKHRDHLFPNTPVLVLASEPRIMSPELLRTNATAVTQRVSLPGMVEDVLQLQPQTTNIVVVFGGSALERFWTEHCRREFQVFTNRLGFTWVNDLTLEQMVKHCTSLPPRSFILHVLFIVDAAGVPCERNEALRQLHEVANAPVFAFYTSEFGLGSMGGRLFQDIEVGAHAAQTAVRILRGERPDVIPVQILDATVPTYDWRELRRWGISEARLPAGSVLHFRQPTFWERYRWLVIGTSLFCFLQAALIIGLWVNRSKRRQGEAEATLLADISSKFVNLPPTEVDREIVAAQRRICQFLELDLSVLWQVQEAHADFLATHVYQREQNPVPSQPFRQEDFPWVRSEMAAGRTIRFASMTDMPATAERDRETVSRFGIKSTLTIPLSVGGEQPIGVLSFNALQRERNWPESLIKRLQLVAQIFANALARKRADQALHESEERLSLAVNSAEAGLWVMDCRTLDFWASEKARTLFGYSPDEAICLSRFERSVHAEDWALVWQSLNRAMQAGEPINVEYRIRLGDGRERWIASRGRAFPMSDGKPERLQGLSMDITERKHTDEQLRQLSLAVEQSPVAVLITDLEGRMIYVNRQFCEVSGYSLSECLGQNSRILKSGESPAETYREMWACVTSGRTWRGEFHNRRKNGELYREWEVISPLIDAAGKITHFIGVKEDITAQRTAESEAKELRDALAHAGRVTLLGQLASALAHELSQPLGAILRNAEAAEIMLQEPSPDLEELRAIVGDILRDDHRAGDVIDRLRSLLKRGSMSPLPVDLGEVVGEVLALVRSDAAARHVRVESAIASNLPLVLGDRIHLQQVLINLLVNAMDAFEGVAHDKRLVQVTIRMAGATAVEVEVADQGHGIAKEHLPRLFEPFFTTKHSGMGIGLPVSKTIIEAHQGKIWAENDPAGGARFRFTVPVSSGAAIPPGIL